MARLRACAPPAKERTLDAEPRAGPCAKPFRGFDDSVALGRRKRLPHNNASPRAPMWDRHFRLSTPRLCPRSVKHPGGPTADPPPARSVRLTRGVRGLRWWIAGLIFLATLINFLNRLAIA